MNLPDLPANASRLELRKALAQMRLELHRQELRQDTLQLMQPLKQARDFTRHCKTALGANSAPIVGVAAVAAAAVLYSQRQHWPRWLALGGALAPLLLSLWRQASPPAASEEP